MLLGRLVVMVRGLKPRSPNSTTTISISMITMMMVLMNDDDDDDDDDAEAFGLWIQGIRPATVKILVCSPPSLRP